MKCERFGFSEIHAGCLAFVIHGCHQQSRFQIFTNYVSGLRYLVIRRSMRCFDTRRHRRYLHNFEFMTYVSFEVLCDKVADYHFEC